jgi:SAM-dependent methyltransferase
MNYTESYRQHLENLVASNGETAAMADVVGGNYEAVGQLEASLLNTLGVSPSSSILDIGCGTGRLAYALRRSHRGSYVGTDILQELLDHAKLKAARDDWHFLLSSAPPLPLESRSIDVTCVFSVFTHLMDEDVYRYLEDIRRVLKPGGRLIFSYLDFSVYSHQEVFNHMLADPLRTVLNRFTTKSCLGALLTHAGFSEFEFWAGDAPRVQLDGPIAYANGRVESGKVGFGQSIGMARTPSQ